MTTDHDDDFEPHHSSSPTDQVLHELQLYGYRPFNDEPDPRPLPEANILAGSISDIFDALVVALADTRLEPDLEDLLWSTVNVFHRAIERIERELDDNELAQQRSQREQDGSEVKSVELERLTAEGQTLIERRNAFELMRDQAADQFEHHTHSAWRPRNGSKVNHRNLTSAMIDSRDFLAAKKRADNQVLLPAGPKVALTGGLDFNDHRLVWAKLDQVHAKHPDMVLLHGGSPKGAELIAAKWADNRKVPQIAFKPDWTKHAKAAPFKRNDAMLEVLPIGVMHFPGTGIQDNLADKAKKLGIPVWKFGAARERRLPTSRFPSANQPMRFVGRSPIPGRTRRCTYRGALQDFAGIDIYDFVGSEIELERWISPTCRRRHWPWMRPGSTGNRHPAPKPKPPMIAPITRGKGSEANAAWGDRPAAIKPR